jgi:zinc resistance-associated protein
MKTRKHVAYALVAAMSVAGAAAVANAQTQAPPAPPPAADTKGPADSWGPWMGHGMGMGMGWDGPRMSREDRAAFLDARLAAMKAGLRLTPDQEKLWGPAESAVREMAKTMGDLRDKAKEAGKPKDPIDGMQRMAAAQIARGQALKKVADAAAPLYASLTPEQKERLPMLAHPGMRGRVGAWMHDHGMHWGRDHDRDDGPRGWRHGWGSDD